MAEFVTVAFAFGLPAGLLACLAALLTFLLTAGLAARVAARNSGGQARRDETVLDTLEPLAGLRR